MTAIAAGVAVLLIAVVVVFQLALAFGAPLGFAAWGGRHPDVLPTRLRIASAVAALVVYPIIGLEILASAELIEADWLPFRGDPAMWALAGFLTLGALANFVSRSKRERYWGPVALAIAICCAALTTPG